MATLMIGPDEERQIAALIDLARANPLTRAYLERMAVGFDPANPATRNPAAEVLPLHFTIDLPVGVRVTYTEEDQPFGRCRHISASVGKPNVYLHPTIVDELLRQFGFVGRLGDPAVKVWPERYANGRGAVNVLEPMTAVTQ